MKFAFYPGCVSRGGCPELYVAANLVCDKLGIELEEMPGASCTGAGVLQEKNRLLGDVLNARTFAMAEKIGSPIMTICSTCQGVMAQARYRMSQDSDYLAEVNSHLADEGLHYSGDIEIKHLLWVLIEDYGLDKLLPLITKPLKGIRLSPFYGCYIVRPSVELQTDDNPERKVALETLIEALGAVLVDFEGKTKCCGFPILTINPKNSMSMVAKHTSDVKDLGADAMVTPCPLCHLNLDGFQPKAAAQAGRSIDMPIIHLPQMLGMAMGISPKELGMKRHIVSTSKLEVKLQKA
ncbi:MAG TPA: heterodisulfide reductase [Dehalococcoidia bacterium]|mgnify:FL=1|jgi:succinate dehydrogenase / fumarate reductase, cytochrome b subunit|nr:heterodisulfide reductase [Dehalococcoidia bacterium]